MAHRNKPDGGWHSFPKEHGDSQPMKGNSIPTHQSSLNVSSESDRSLSFWMEWADEQQEANVNARVHEMMVINEAAEEDKDLDESHCSIHGENKNSNGQEENFLRIETATDMVGCPLQLVGDLIQEANKNVINQDDPNEEKEEIPECQDQKEKQVRRSQGVSNTHDMVLSRNSDEVLFQAMKQSTKATRLLERKDYHKALIRFHKAIGLYEALLDESIMAAVNAANCYRNMSTVSRMLEKYEEASDYSRQSVVLYHRARFAVLDHFKTTAPSPIMTLDGKLLDDSSAVPNESCIHTDVLCLDMIIIETLQQQANLLIKYQDDMQGAIAAHEVAARHLVDIASESKSGFATEAIQLEGISYVMMNESVHSSLLGRTLETLGSYYTESYEVNETPSMGLYEEALNVLQARLANAEHSDPLVHCISLVLRYLSEIYFIRGEIDRSVSALHNSMSVKLAASGEPDPEALKILDKMGAANEKTGNFNKARLCYQQTLVARCNFYGRTHLCVAQCLANLGGIAEKQHGTTKESADLFKAANSIYALHMKALATPTISREVNDILQHVPEVSREFDNGEVFGKLGISLNEEDKQSHNEQSTRDRAQLYFDLGRSYMSMGNFKMATTCIISAIKEVDQEDECELHSALQSLESAGHQNTTDEERAKHMNTSIQTLASVFSNSKTTTPQPAPATISHDEEQCMQKEQCGTVPLEGWAHFSFLSEAGCWQKTTGEEKTEVGNDDLENDLNYNLLCESLRIENTPKVKHGAHNELNNLSLGSATNINDGGNETQHSRLSLLACSCWPTKPNQPKLLPHGVALTTRRVVSRGRRAFGNFFRPTAKVRSSKSVDTKDSERLLSALSNCKTFDESPLSAFANPSDLVWHDPPPTRQRTNQRIAHV